MLISPKAGAQTVTNIAVLKGLAPLTILDHSEVGKAALGSNFTVTGGIQTGTITVDARRSLPTRTELTTAASRSIRICGLSRCPATLAYGRVPVVTRD